MIHFHLSVDKQCAKYSRAADRKSNNTARSAKMAEKIFRPTKEDSALWIGYLGGGGNSPASIPSDSVRSITYLGGIGPDTTVVIEFKKAEAK